MGANIEAVSLEGECSAENEGAWKDELATGELGGVNKTAWVSETDESDAND